MRSRMVILFLSGLAIAWMSLNFPASGNSQEAGASDGEQVLARGPIHEAFAQPVVFDAKPGTTVPKQPPKPIEEMPPAEKPAGENVQWISGYWAWDDDRGDFIWVSGLWRSIPSGMEWTPGYWTQASGGWQWISGYWARTDLRQVEYLPEPPQTEEYGPPTEAPGDNAIWAPGCWIWYATRYVWRPGHWIQDHPGWIWCPCYYVYTPRGYVFVDGYWDYSFRRRGLIFAPVYLTAGVYGRPRFVYSPTVVIDVDAVVDHLFVVPRYHHYVFGDYYASTYLTAGIYPWFSFHMSRYGYDPIYAYYQRHYRGTDPGWADRIRSQYRYLRTNERYRPARTLASQSTVINQVQRDASAGEHIAIDSLKLAKPLREIASTQGGAVRIERLDNARRNQLLERQKELQQAREKRTELESKSGGAPSRTQPPQKIERPKTPITASGSTGETRERMVTPPPPAAPKLDPEAKPPVRRSEGLPRPESQIEPRKDRVEPPGKTQRPPAKTESKPPAKTETKPPPRGGESKKPPL
jgi:YXWGXW repeat-containing protein